MFPDWLPLSYLHTIGTIKKCNRKLVETDNIDSHKKSPLNMSQLSAKFIAEHFKNILEQISV
jgi:hypothetical protein